MGGIRDILDDKLRSNYLIGNARSELSDKLPQSHDSIKRLGGGALFKGDKMKKSFQEIVDIITQADGDPTKLISNYEDVLEFIIDVDSAGAFIMESKSDDYVASLYAMVTTCALFIMMSRKLCSFDDVIGLSSNETISKYVALILKITLGLSVMEELR